MVPILQRELVPTFAERIGADARTWIVHYFSLIATVAKRVASQNGPKRVPCNIFPWDRARKSTRWLELRAKCTEAEMPIQMQERARRWVMQLIFDSSYMQFSVARVNPLHLLAYHPEWCPS